MSCRLKVDLRGYWHAGTGRGGGALQDALVHRDSVGLPVLPGRHLKGLLREALERAETLGWVGHAGLAEVLFGARTETVEGGRPRPGCLRVSDAMLAPEVGEWLAHSEAGRGLIPHLFRTLHATAVDAESGTALDGSLRGIEVTVPLMLEAIVEPIAGCEGLPPEWPTRLREVLPLIDAVGAQRKRGLGRAVLSLEDE